MWKDEAMTKDALIEMLSECYDRRDAGYTVAEQANADVKAVDKLIREHGFDELDAAEIPEAAFYKKKQQRRAREARREAHGHPPIYTAISSCRLTGKGCIIRSDDFRR
jgi:hypothetical protein